MSDTPAGRGPVMVDRQLLHEVAEALYWIANAKPDIRLEDSKMVIETIRLLADECRKLEWKP